MKDGPKLKADKVLNVKSVPIYSIKSLLNVYTNHFPITLYLSVNSITSSIIIMVIQGFQLKPTTGKFFRQLFLLKFHLSHY